MTLLVFYLQALHCMDLRTVSLSVGFENGLSSFLAKQTTLFSPNANQMRVPLIVLILAWVKKGLMLYQ